MSYEVNWSNGEFEIWKVFSKRLGKQITISQRERENIMQELEQR